MYIKNRGELTSHGYKKGREAAITMVERALTSANPYVATKNLISLQGEVLTIGSLHFDLVQRGNIYVLGAGKATFPIAKALEEILGERITRGLIVIKKGQEGTLEKIEVRRASHPIPDEDGFDAAEDIKRIAEKAQMNDIVFCAITGGSSALMPLPISPITLEEKRQINKLLLASGATIREINTVRKHLSDIKGGKLALSIFPAEIINLTVSDVTGDPLEYITGPTVPDTSTFPEAISILKKYNLGDKFPKSAIRYLQNATPQLETPKDFGEFKSLVHSFTLIKPGTVCEAAAEKAKELGFTPFILTTMLEGESREVGIMFAGIAKEIKHYNRPLSPPCAIIAGGETTVKIGNKCGEGGPNQEFALSAALQLAAYDKVVIAALDTDGTDGPTGVAGGLIDNSTTKRAKEKNFDIFEHLLAHDASKVLLSVGDAIVTGSTGTNANDLKILLVDR
ncbi:D-glycerate 2-kinase [subsurface metagenome]